MLNFLRRLKRKRRIEVTPDGWLVNFNGDPATIPTKCTWCDSPWIIVPPDNHMLCPVCDFVLEVTHT